MVKLISILGLTTLPLLADKIPVYLGTGSNQGIFYIDLDTTTGALSGLKNVAVTASPASLALSEDKSVLYAIGRDKGEKHGFVASFARAEDYSLTAISKQSSKGAGPCHLSLDKGSDNLFVANYSGGSVASFSISKEAGKVGVLSEAVSSHQHAGSSVNEKRQKGPHAHSIYASHDNRYVYAADLGIDKVLIYKLDEKTGALTSAGFATTPAGAGPRHMAFSKDGSKLFVLNELTLTISQFARNAETGALTLEQTKNVMAASAENAGEITCSEIQLSADGKYLYAACRDLKKKGRDSISVINVETLEIIQEQLAGISIPRHFGISPSGKWFLIAGQNSDKVIVHSRDLDTGKLTKTEHSADLKRPMWILFP